jgi:hypothetical protein
MADRLQPPPNSTLNKRKSDDDAGEQNAREGKITQDAEALKNKVLGGSRSDARSKLGVFKAISKTDVAEAHGCQLFKLIVAFFKDNVIAGR